MRNALLIVLAIVAVVVLSATLGPSLLSKVGGLTYSTAKGESSAECAGVRQTVSLGEDAEMINDGGDCNMAWYIDKGPFILIDGKGKETPFATVKPFTFNAVKWRCENGKLCKGYAWFCPKPSNWDDEEKACKGASPSRTVTR